MSIFSPPTIRTEGIVLELVQDGLFVDGNLSSQNEDLVEQFSLLSSIHQEISQLVRKKLLESFELKNYEVSKQIEWLNKFIELLSQQEANNQNADSPVLPQWTPAERHEKLEAAQQELRDLENVAENVEQRQERAEDVLNGQLNQIRIVCPNTPISGGSVFKLSNESWRAVVEKTMKLRKIHMICEKLEGVEEKLEVKFWVEEIERLMQLLDDERKEIGIGLIIELICWKTSMNSSSNNWVFPNSYGELLDSLFDQQNLKQKVLNQVENYSAQNEEQIDDKLNAAKILAEMFVRIKENELVFRVMFGEVLCKKMISVLEHGQLRENQWNSVINVIELIGPQLGSEMVEKFERMFKVLEGRSFGETRLLQNRISESLRFWKPASPTSLAHLPVITAAASTESFSVRNFTVIENPVGNVGISRSVSQRSLRSFEEEKEEMRKQIEEDVRRKMEEEYRIKEDMRREQEKKLEQERMQKEFQETLRLQQEQMRKDIEAELKRKEEEERKRKEVEEANRKKLEEERKRKELEKTMRVQREQQIKHEAELKRKQEDLRKEEERKREEEKRRQEEAERKRKEEEEKLKRCTFLPAGSTLYLHTNPLNTYNERALDGKIIGLLFSGYWCMPCQEFVPILNNFYQQVENYFEVLFISSDRNENEMNYFLKNFHGRWFNLPFQSALGNCLKEKLVVNSIPSLIIVTPNGQVISHDARSEVQNCVDAGALVAKWMRCDNLRL